MKRRGIPLVDRVIAYLETSRRTKGDGLTPETIERLVLPDGTSLPLSLQRVLAWDATYLEHVLDDSGQLQLCDFDELLDDAFGTNDGFEMFERLLEGKCL